MFIVREYAAFILMALVLTTTLLAACGFGYMLKAAYRALSRAMQSDRGPETLRFSGEALRAEAEPGAVAESSS
jgi:hypothetical protein